jgi:hypothetical protein
VEVGGMVPGMNAGSNWKKHGKPNGTSVRIYCLLGNLRNAIRPGNSA